VRVVDLVTATREDAAPAFGGEARVPARALTTGLGTLYRARELILLVIGAAKAPALRAMLAQPVGPASPASLLRDHPRLMVICDREAASLLDERPEWTSDRVAVVLGHRELGINPEHRISSAHRDVSKASPHAGATSRSRARALWESGGTRARSRRAGMSVCSGRDEQRTVVVTIDLRPEGPQDGVSQRRR
jgi:hypothetical protein